MKKIYIAIFEYDENIHGSEEDFETEILELLEKKGYWLVHHFWLDNYLIVICKRKKTDMNILTPTHRIKIKPIANPLRKDLNEMLKLFNANIESVLFYENSHKKFVDISDDANAKIDKYIWQLILVLLCSEEFCKIVETNDSNTEDNIWQTWSLIFKTLKDIWAKQEWNKYKTIITNSIIRLIDKMIPQCDCESEQNELADIKTTLGKVEIDYETFFKNINKLNKFISEFCKKQIHIME